MINLSLCFKSKTEAELKKIHNEYFKNLGNTIIDMPSLWWRSDKSLQNNCEIINEHYIDNELSKGKGVILLTPHTVSLDFGGRSISRYPIISIYKPFRNKLLNWFVGKASKKPALQEMMTEMIASKEAQENLHSKWFMLKTLLF